MARHPYIYGSAAPKRDFYEPAPSKSKQGKQNNSSRTEIYSDRQINSSQSASQAFAYKALKATLVFVLMFAVVGFGRIAFASATVSEALRAREVTRNLEEARSSINDMQVEQSSLANPVRIKMEAEALDMATPSTIHVIDISGDLVTLTDGGKLSLTGTIEAKVQAESAALAQATK